MVAFSSYLAQKVAGATLCGSSFITSVATVYVALATAASNGGDIFTEIVGNAYARQNMAFAAPVSRQTPNAGTVTFPQATADWGTVTHFGLYDALSGGNQLYWGPLDVADNVLNGRIFQVDAAGLIVRHD